MKKEIKTIAIIGAGPSGSVLATLLHRKGYKVGLFYVESRPELIVGESMVPAIIPLLRELGVEEEVKSYSTYKPGASVWVSKDQEENSPFSNGKGKLPSYAYNVPRDRFDQTLFNLAKREGVQLFNQAAKVEKTGKPDEVALSESTLQLCGDYFGGQPDLIVDATGRSRLISRLLNIDTKTGTRKDISLFAHLEGGITIDQGDIHLHRLTAGWAWRIPLIGKTSVGFVIHPDHLKALGKTKEEQYDNYLKTEEVLQKFTKDAKRVSAVMQYNNYQLTSQRYFGENWLLVGDSGGFLDPIFSSGLFLALKGAFEAAAAIETNTPSGYLRYQKAQLWELEVWQKVVDTWYSGRLFTLFKVGEDRMDTAIGRVLAPHMRKNLTRIFTGEAVYSNYSRYFLSFVTGAMIDMMKMGRLHNRNVADLEIK